MNRKIRIAALSAITAATVLIPMSLSAAAFASPVQTSSLLCQDQTGAGNSPSVTFPNGGDMGFYVSTCIAYSSTLDEYNSEIIIDWHDADNNRPAVPFDALTAHVETQDFDDPNHTNDCDFTSAMNNATGTSGEFVCQTGYYTGHVSGYYMTSDGYIDWNINNDGLGNMPNNQLTGSPVFYDAHGLIRHNVAVTAAAEASNNTRNFEYRGSDNCTYYAGVMTSWPTCGKTTGGVAWRGGTSNGDSTYAWCAVFANYIYQTVGGINRAGITTFADSFRTTYGGTWHPAGDGFSPLPGDAVLFDWDGDGKADHVALVYSNISGNITIVEGNSSNDDVQKVANHGSILGYAALTYS